MKYEMNRSPLTILLTVKGRPTFTKRWLDYMSLIQFEHNIVIADGDADGYIKELIENKSYEELNIDFFEYRQTVNYIDYYKMIVAAIERAHSDYVMLCDNDDFLLPSGINKILSFLKMNPEHISRGGYITGFNLNGGTPVDYGSSFRLSFFYEKLFRLEEPSSNWYSFIEEVLFNFQSSFYNIHTKEALFTIYNEIVEMNFTDLTVSERYFQMRLPSLGRVTYDPSAFHYLRQKGTSNSANLNVPLEILMSDMPSDTRKLAKKISSTIDEEDKEFEAYILDKYAEYYGYYFSHTSLKYRFTKLFNCKLAFMNSSVGKSIKKCLNIYENYKLLRKVRKWSHVSIYQSFDEEIKVISNFITKPR